MTFTHYKAIFFHGYIIAFSSILSIAFFFDLYIKNYTDTILEICTLTLVVTLYYLWHKSTHKTIFPIIIAWISALFGILIILQYDFTTGSPFLLLFIPFSFLYLLDKTVLFIHLGLYYLLAIAIMTWGYFNSNNRLFFDSPQSLSVWLALFIFVFAIGIFNYIMLSRSFSYLEKSNVQKGILLQEIHHRVKNNLNMMSSMIGLQETHNDPKMEMFVKNYRNRINSIALIHDLLYMNDNYEKIDFKTYVRKLSSYLVESCSQPESTVTIHTNNIALEFKTVSNLGFILQELISNSLKHANSGHTQIKIDFIVENKEYILTYSDNGYTDKIITPSSHGLGMSLVQMKTEELQGTLDIAKVSKKLYTLTMKNDEEFTENYYTYIYTIRFPYEA